MPDDAHDRDERGPDRPWQKGERPRRRRPLPPEDEPDPSLKYVIPINTTPLAIAAG